MSFDATRTARLEHAAEEVAEAKQYLVALDRRQHQYREATRVLRKSREADDVWLLCSGRVFVKSNLRPKGTLNYLFWKLYTGEKEIENGREELKAKVAFLAELEGPDQTISKYFQGFELKSMTPEKNGND
ncbi:p53 and DNA damage-regulated protein 1 [Trypanosoma rangeli]|uniref:p53 and DNA damage-regulated protein 1 n=1 Tax=Trypanosoma rangeli TaxID=5698 RepID=A0A3R7N3H7_TRYRA|nr:p53 and DNA damage-regulated protein 1 [Trypanosoma rangeli]RNE99508.1 p53 and DNA damage-regulated protein 1 [Trypanosoma rangeli]|eukprot:RNE99508.1 p53 and DNA damage-regulated protein 1 [Trypanosoma rangeli]